MVLPRHGLVRVVTAAAITVMVAWLLVAAAAVLPGTSAVARADSGAEAQKLTLFEDLLIGPGEVWNTVVVIGGDVVVRGTIEDLIVVVGGDLSVESTAVIGQGPGQDAQDTSIVSVFGEISIAANAQVSGRITDVAAGFSDMTERVFDSVLWPWRTGSVLGWIWTFIGAVVVALIVVVAAPRQVAAMRDRIRAHFFTSLGWGALSVFIGVPLVTALLVVTVVGILALAPWLAIVLPLLFLFGFVSFATWIGSAIIRRWDASRENLLLAAIIGVVILSIVRFVPGLGALVLFAAGMVGFGATIVALLTSRRRPPRGGQAATGEIVEGEPIGHEPPTD